MVGLEQHKSKIAVLLIHEKKDGTIRQSRIKNLFLIAAAVIVLLAVIALAANAALDNSEEINNQLLEYEKSVAALNEEIFNLQQENFELNNKLTILSETVATKAALEEVKEEEILDISLPKGFPLGGSGSTTMEEDEEYERTLVFYASEGNTVITVGAGVVEAVEADEKYGNRLVINHQNGYKSVYLNKGAPLVKTGEELGKRYILFLVGDDNKTLGFQIIEQERQIDPLTIMEISG